MLAPLHNEHLDVLLGFFSERNIPRRAGGAHFTAQPGAAWSHFPPVPSPAHSCWLTHRWVTQSPLLAQGLRGARNALCCLPPFHCCSTLPWSFLSLIKHVLYLQV